jgi:hypothetical protein
MGGRYDSLYSRAMRSRLVPLAALGLLGAYLVIALASGLRNTLVRLRAAAITAGLSPAEVRSRVFGRRYQAAVERIRRAIPEDEPYLLTEQNEAGALLWVRYDLLPRRAVVVQPDTRQGDCWLEQLRWMVVGVGIGKPPLLYRRQPRVPPGCVPEPWRAGVGSPLGTPPGNVP